MRARLLHLAGATLAGSVIATATLLIVFFMFDADDWNAMAVMVQTRTPLVAVGSLCLFVLVSGVLPTLLIGSLLIALERGTPQRLVLTPAILFILVCAELARETHSATLSVLALPAIVTGGAAMFWILSRWKIPQPVEAVFE